MQTQAIEPLRPPAHRAQRTAYALIACWVLVMVSIPILRWIWGDAILPLATTLSVVMQAAASICVLWAAWGPTVTLRICALTLPLAWAIEFAGSTTGLPFGAYHYTGLLQPQLAGVPLLIPLAWLMMLPPAWAVACLLTSTWRPLPVALATALAFTAWDLFLDPQMVAWGYWQWQHPGAYFGIPWMNYAGWMLSAFLITWLVLARVGPPWPPLVPLLLIYTITWLLQTIGLALFWSMPGPAAAGGAVMGACVLVAWWRLRTRGSPAAAGAAV